MCTGRKDYRAALMSVEEVNSLREAILVVCVIFKCRDSKPEPVPTSVGRFSSEVTHTNKMKLWYKQATLSTPLSIETGTVML